MKRFQFLFVVVACGLVAMGCKKDLAPAAQEEAREQRLVAIESENLRLQEDVSRLEQESWGLRADVDRLGKEADNLSRKIDRGIQRVVDRHEYAGVDILYPALKRGKRPGTIAVEWGTGLTIYLFPDEYEIVVKSNEIMEIQGEVLQAIGMEGKSFPWTYNVQRL